MSEYASTSKFTEGGIYETEVHRLQREADNFTKKYEHERKRYMILDDQFKQALKEKKAKEDELSKNRPTTALQKKDKIKLKQLENQLEKGQVTFNNTVSTNEEAKKRIDVMRKEILTAKRVLGSLDDDINSKREEIKTVNEKVIKAKKNTEDTNVRILVLKSRHEAEKQTFEKKIMELQDKLDVKDETAGELEKSTMKETSTMKKGHTTMEEHEEFYNPADLLRARLSKWSSNNREKKHLLDKYIKNVKIIEDAFEQIKEQTGISSIDEIVTTFIKAEEQNYSLYNYVNVLNSGIDTIEEQNKNISDEIKSFEELTKMSDEQKKEKADALKQEIFDVKSNNEMEDTKMQELENNMGKIQSSVQKMVTQFQLSKFRPAVTQPMSYDEETVFNNKNVTLFLAELEEYISELITHNEYKKNNPNAAISAIPLEKLQPKTKERTGLKPDIPSKEDIKVTEEIQETDEDKELIFKGKDLYKKFEDLVKKNQISY